MLYVIKLDTIKQQYNKVQKEEHIPKKVFYKDKREEKDLLQKRKKNIIFYNYIINIHSKRL